MINIRIKSKEAAHAISKSWLYFPESPEHAELYEISFLKMVLVYFIQSYSIIDLIQNGEIAELSTCVK